MAHLARRPLIVAVAVLALLALAPAGSALAGNKPGNSPNAKLCQKGGWTKLIDASAHEFTDESACVSYGAHDGAVYALATLQLQPCASQPYDGLCVNPSGSGLKPGSVVTETLSKNGSAVRRARTRRPRATKSLVSRKLSY